MSLNRLCGLCKYDPDDCWARKRRTDFSCFRFTWKDLPEASKSEDALDYVSVGYDDEILVEEREYTPLKASQLAHFVERELEYLGSRTKKVFILSVYDGIDADKVAAEVGITKEDVKTIVSDVMLYFLNFFRCIIAIGSPEIMRRDAEVLWRYWILRDNRSKLYKMMARPDLQLLLRNTTVDPSAVRKFRDTFVSSYVNNIKFHDVLIKRFLAGIRFLVYNTSNLYSERVASFITLYKEVEDSMTQEVWAESKLSKCYKSYKYMDMIHAKYRV